MKARIDAIIRPEQAEYLERLLPPSTGILAEMEEYAAAHRVPIADREVAAFLEITARAMNAKRVLEIGMAIAIRSYTWRRPCRRRPRRHHRASEEMIRLSEDYLTRAGLSAPFARTWPRARSHAAPRRDFRF